MSGRVTGVGAKESQKGAGVSQGGGHGGSWGTGARFSQFVSRLSISNRSRTTPLPAPTIREPPRSRHEQVGRHVGSIVVTHTGDGMHGGEGGDSIFARRVSSASGRASIAGHLFGLSRQPLAPDAAVRRIRKRSTVEDDGLTKDEIESVRERCKRMISAAETAGGTACWADARKAMLTTVFETHPALDHEDLQTYLSLRGLITNGQRWLYGLLSGLPAMSSANEDKAEDVDPERIRELAVALFLLIRKRALTFDSVVRVAYTIFDQDGDGELDKDEFQQLMNATLRTHLTLDFVLRLPAGKEAFLRHLKEEYAQENFYFWQSSEQFASSLPTVAKAQTLYDGYIREGAPKQVNISAQTNEGIRKKWHAVQNGEAPLTRKLFTAAQAEVFNLMQKDNFERFRTNTRSMEDFVDCMFKEVDRSNNGRVSLEEYTEWATNNRDVMGFMRATGGKVAVIRGLPTKTPQGSSGGKDSDIHRSDGSSGGGSGGVMKFLSAAINDMKQEKTSRLVLVRSNPAWLPRPSSSSFSSSPSSSARPPFNSHVPKSRNGSEPVLGGSGDSGDGDGGGSRGGGGSSRGSGGAPCGVDRGGGECCAAQDGESSPLYTSTPPPTPNPTPSGTSTVASCPTTVDRTRQPSTKTLSSPVSTYRGVIEVLPSGRRSFSGVDDGRQKSWRQASSSDGGSGVGGRSNDEGGDDLENRRVDSAAERDKSSIGGGPTATTFFDDARRRIRLYTSSFRKFSELGVVLGKRWTISRYRLAPSGHGSPSGLEPALADTRLPGGEGGRETQQKPTDSYPMRARSELS